MTALGLAVRGTHLAASLLVVGAFTVLLLGGPPRWPTARAWQERVLAATRAALLVVLVAGLGVLGWQTALAEGRGAAAVEPQAVGRFLLETRSGHAWLARHGLLVLLAAFMTARGDDTRKLDWLASRGQGWLLAGTALALLAAGGHAAAASSGATLAMVVDALHLLAAGAWLGGFLPLAALLRVAGTEAGAEARPYAVRTARRFSSLAVAAVAVLALTGAAGAATFVGGIPALVGTPYGRLLLAKLAVIASVLAVASINRRRLLPALAGEATTVGRPAMQRLARLVTLEALLGLVLVGLAATMALTPPGRHVQPEWPLPFRLTLSGLDDVPGASRRLLLGSQVALLGLVAVVASALVTARRVLLRLGGLAAVLAGGALALPPLAVDAYPTTYRRPEVPYEASSIVEGGRLYAAHCAGCHGPRGAGDGRQAAGLPRPPADLRSPHTVMHTAGDLFWWITTGIPRSGMPAFGDRLSEQERWDVINFVRALAAAEAARTLGPTLEPGRVRLAAPDIRFSVGPLRGQSLRQYRGRRAVLLVLYTLPASRPRLARLAGGYQRLAALGAEVIAVPRDAAPDALRRLAVEPPALFPVVTDGAHDIAGAYSLFAATPHAEFLIDRQGYLRTRWAAGGVPERDLDLLVADLTRLDEEPAPPRPADEHVH